jgi:hypothetical protein
MRSQEPAIEHSVLFNLGEIAHGAQFIRDWVVPRSGLDAVEDRKILPLPGFETRLSRTYLVSIPTDLIGSYSKVQGFTFRTPVELCSRYMLSEAVELSRVPIQSLGTAALQRQVQ